MTRYTDAFRERGAAQALRARLADDAARLDGDFRAMEVCGSHTMAIARYGLRELLPPRLRLVSGPGCPVCVTDPGYLDAAIALGRQGAILATFGDLLHAPASAGDLAGARAEGVDVEVCTTPLAALELARRYPDREVVFLAIGFETTVAPVVSLVPRARAAGLRNLSLLTAFKTIPPALEALVAEPDVPLDGLLCPAHVSAVIGADAYRPFAERHGRPCVIAGFEPLDILLGLHGLLAQRLRGEARVENQYDRVVRPGGNPRALALMHTLLEPEDAHWRGLGTIPGSGLRLRAAYADTDAARRHGIEVRPGRPRPGCRCGDVLKGRIEPADCPLFGRGCSPDRPVGPCMVSAEGSCAAAFRFGLLEPGANRR